MKKQLTYRLITVLLMSMTIISCTTSNKKNNDAMKKSVPPMDTLKKSSTSGESIDAMTSETQIVWLKKNQALKKEGLLGQSDDRVSLKEHILTKEIYEETDDYIIDYTYPYLNEVMNSTYTVFNEYMTENYLDLDKTVEELLENRMFLCDSSQSARMKEQRLIDFKIHATANDLISILLYKENYYSGMAHSAYTFDCLNYDVKKQRFINFDDFFVKNAQEEMLQIINTQIQTKIESGDLYIACWQLAKSDLQIYKNNFIVDGESIEFYFDDCIICPAYTGTYSIAIPIPKILHLISDFQKPLVI